MIDRVILADMGLIADADTDKELADALKAWRGHPNSRKIRQMVASHVFGRMAMEAVVQAQQGQAGALGELGNEIINFIALGPSRDIEKRAHALMTRAAERRLKLTGISGGPEEDENRYFLSTLEQWVEADVDRRIAYLKARIQAALKAPVQARPAQAAPAASTTPQQVARPTWADPKLDLALVGKSVLVELGVIDDSDPILADNITVLTDMPKGPQVKQKIAEDVFVKFAVEVVTLGQAAIQGVQSQHLADLGKDIANWLSAQDQQDIMGVAKGRMLRMSMRRFGLIPMGSFNDEANDAYLFAMLRHWVDQSPDAHTQELIDRIHGALGIGSGGAPAAAPAPAPVPAANIPSPPPAPKVAPYKPAQDFTRGKPPVITMPPEPVTSPPISAAPAPVPKSAPTSPPLGPVSPPAAIPAPVAPAVAPISASQPEPVWAPLPPAPNVDPDARRLPVYLLLDCSGSMAGDPMESMRAGIRSLTSDLKNDPQALETAWLSVITFGNGAKQVMPLTDLMNFQEPDLTADGITSLGQALRVLDACMAREVRPATGKTKGDWNPLVFVMTDGLPTDPWEETARRLVETKKANIIACAAGSNADGELLKALTPNVVELQTLQPDALKAFFSWASTSIKSASLKKEGDGPDLPPPPAGVTIVP